MYTRRAGCLGYRLEVREREKVAYKACMRCPAGGGCRIINELNCVEGIVLCDDRMRNTGNIQNVCRCKVLLLLVWVCVGV